MKPILVLLLAVLFPLAVRSSDSLPEEISPVPRLAKLSIDQALTLTRQHLESKPSETTREIVGIQFIPPHGRPGPGFWLIDLAPYPADRPTPAAAFTSLLLGMDGTIEERGGRKPLNPEEQQARNEKAATFQKMMREKTSASP